MDWKIVLLLAALLVLYLTAGAYLFQHLERRETQQMITGRYTMQDLDGQGSNSTNSSGLPLPSNFTELLLDRHPALSKENLTDLVNMIVTAYEDGTIPRNSSEDDGVDWDIATSFFFVGTIVTTIGYGNVAPITQGGRLATIFYGLFGIPLCLIFLAAIGEKIVRGCKRIEKAIGHRECQKCDKVCHVARVAILITLGWTLFLMIPALVFSHLEGWRYSDGVYFAFVTLSTIGFGDLTVGAQSSSNMAFYRICTVCWVYLGLAWLSAVISLFADILQKGLDEGETKVHEKVKHGLKAFTKNIGKVCPQSGVIKEESKSRCSTPLDLENSLHETSTDLVTEVNGQHNSDSFLDIEQGRVSQQGSISKM